MLTPQETRRYARHLVLKGIGGAGQNRVKAAKVLVIGAGGLGSPAIAYLAAAGIGTLGVVDDDRLALSNLQRQVIHTSAAIGTLKTESAAAFVHGINDNVRFVGHAVRLEVANALGLIADYDLVLDGSDTFETRQATAAAAATARVPLVAGAVSQFDGQVTVIAPHLTRADGRPGPDFAALYPQTPDPDDLPSCEAVGVLGPVTGVIGTLMAMEAIKLITGVGEPLIGRLLLYDGKAARFTELAY